MSIPRIIRLGWERRNLSDDIDTEPDLDIIPRLSTELLSTRQQLRASESARKTQRLALLLVTIAAVLSHAALVLAR